MLIFVSLVLALGVSLYWIADAVADILQQRRLKKSMENILKAVMSKEYKTNSVNFAKSIDEHNSKTDKKPKTKVTDIKKIKLNY